MDIRKVKKLIELLEESDLAEIEIHEGEESVRISRSSQVLAAAAVPAAPTTVAAPAPAVTSDKPVETAPSGQAITAPMVGTFSPLPCSRLQSLRRNRTAYQCRGHPLHYRSDENA